MVAAVQGLYQGCSRVRGLGKAWAREGKTLPGRTGECAWREAAALGEPTLEHAYLKGLVNVPNCSWETARGGRSLRMEL